MVASVLIVDDHRPNLLALEAVLSPLRLRIVAAGSGEEALLLLRKEEFAVVLLDVMMPGLDGLGTADLIRSERHGRELPIIFMTAGDTPALAGYAHGAVDVLRKPLERDVVRAKVAVFVELFQARDQIRQQAARLEQQERRADARTAALLNASLDAIVGMDQGGRITEFNRAAEQMFGRRKEQVLGELLSELIPFDRRNAHRESLARYLESGESQALDTRIEVPALRADGSEFAIELAVRKVDAEGPATFLAYARDLTARRRQEHARAFLAHASESMARSLHYEVTLQTVAQLAVPQLADWCAVEILREDSSETEQLVVAHTDPTKVALARELRRLYPSDPDARRGVPNVLRTGRSELYEEIPAALLEQHARDAEHLSLLRRVAPRSAMIVPLATRGGVIGAITFVVSESARHFEAFDLGTAEELARRAAMAIENARLYRQTVSAAARSRFLAEATELLASSLDYATTLERVVRLTVPAIADSAAIYQREDDGRIELLALAADSVEQEARLRELDMHLPLQVDDQKLLARVIRTGRAELLPEVSQPVRESWSPTARAGELVQQLALRSYMAVPVVVRGNVFGALALTTSSSRRRLGTDDRDLATELTRRAGLAIENAQLYREAQMASRLKDEFLATVSHELRTPLTAMLAWIHVLRSDRPEKVGRAVETIERSAHAQARIVDDLLDVSRIVAGTLSLELEVVQLGALVQAAIDTVRPLAESRQIELSVELQPDAGQMTGDAARLQQVVWNLLSNAIKFTPRGGRVSIGLERRESSVYLRVADDGDGIRGDFLPFVFERFRQGDTASTRKHGGLGLGLAIVRHIVELHGGSITASSDGEGRGATFTVVLPSRGLVQPDPS